MLTTSLLIILLMVSALLFIFIFGVEVSESNNDNNTSFECGFNPILSNNITFSTNFLLVIMLFLVFDVEISFLLPTIIMSNSSITSIHLVCVIFLVALTIIMLNEWNQGTLEWNN